MSMKINGDLKAALVKVPEVTFVFWVIKIFATTLGETAGDAMSMSMNLGYLTSTFIFGMIFNLFVAFQIKSKTFNPYLYWATIIATTTVGTTMADFATRSLGIGYTGGTAILLSLLILSLFVWHRVMGSISISTIDNPVTEIFYWVTIMFSQTLGTALGDWTADTQGLGYTSAAIIFGSLLAFLAFLHYKTKTSKTILFWAAFVLTRPLGAVVGDFLDKPIDKGGLALSRFTASEVLFVLILICLIIFKQKAAQKAH